MTIKGDFQSRTVWLDGKMLSPKTSQSIVNHSPDGFNWSYSGSGPAQLALALLLKFDEKEFAVRWYQEFKRDKIAGLPRGNFEMDSQEITDWITAKKG